MGLLAHQPIDPFLFAESLSIGCIPHKDICKESPNFECLNSSSWSAMLIRSGNFALIVFNSSLASVRIFSSIVHEIAHYILDHRTVSLFSQYYLFQRDYTAAQEAEANCLSYTLLLPRPMILKYAMQNAKADQIMEETGLSLDLVRYRISISGVRNQYKNWNPF
jgi:Zn-dependent peptidase ImmA (M78 family)